MILHSKPNCCLRNIYPNNDRKTRKKKMWNDWECAIVSWFGSLGQLIGLMFEWVIQSFFFLHGQYRMQSSMGCTVFGALPFVCVFLTRIAKPCVKRKKSVLVNTSFQTVHC